MKPSLRSLLAFLVPVSLVLGSALTFTARQLAAPLAPGWTWMAWVLAAAFWAFPFVRMLFFRESRVGALQTLAFFLLGLGATLFMALLLVWLSAWPLAWAGFTWPHWIAWEALGLSVAFSLWGWRTALRPARLSHQRIQVPGLHAGLEGLRIVQISDLHVSHLVGEAQVRHLVGQVQALKPDLIAITGDLVDGPRRHLAHAVAPLAGLKAPLGVHYVTGNHEYFWGVDGWLEEFAGLGFEMLTNAHRVLERDGARLLVLGVNDPTAGRMGAAGPDLAQARLGSPSSDFTLFLAHQPSAYSLAEAAGADLFLAGHTHGGQFFPFSLLIGLFHRYAKGLARHSQKLWVYVHPGSGFWGPPNRLGVPPEIAVLELSRA